MNSINVFVDEVYNLEEIVDIINEEQHGDMDANRIVRLVEGVYLVAANTNTSDDILDKIFCRVLLGNTNGLFVDDESGWYYKLINNPFDQSALLLLKQKVNILLGIMYGNDDVDSEYMEFSEYIRTLV